MKNKVPYSIIFVFISLLASAQVKQFDLSLANSQLFAGNLFVYGIHKQDGLCVYKIDAKLNTKDSSKISIGKSEPDLYLPMYADTLHNFLNIYLQKKERKTVTVFRFSKKFELVSKVENIDVARLNNTDMFSSEVLYYKNIVYSVKTETDTSGKQFYLNKYKLKSESGNFDYEFQWQFPFERKNIHSAHIFYANQKYVLLFVQVGSGPKSGQWILKIDQDLGKLLKASKLNEKTEKSVYLFGDFYVDNNYKSLDLIGQKFSESQLDLGSGRFNPGAQTFAPVYHLSLDSLGEISSRQDFKISITDTKTMKPGLKKGTSSYLLRFEHLLRKSDGSLSFAVDLFKSLNDKNCFYYSSSLPFNLVPVEDKFSLDKKNISSNLQIEDYYITADRLDLNGKLCVDSLDRLETFFYKTLTFPVKQQFKLDAEGNIIWLLSKHTFKKNAVNYSLLAPEKKIYKLNTIDETSEGLNPRITVVSTDSFIISSQIEEGKYQLKLYPW